MKCKDCRDFKRCLIEAITRNQIFDTEYEGADCFVLISNADHIRSMSDEELAEFLMLQVQMSKASNAAEILSGFEEITKIAWLNWLKQPHKEKEE